MFRQFALIVFSLMGAFVIESAQADFTLDPEIVLARCESEGAVKIVDEITLRNDHQDWDEMADKVAGGDEAWIKASGCLMAGTHESRSAIDWIILKLAWADALTKKPAAMLEIEYQGTSLEDVCALPQLEPEEDDLARYVKETLEALEKVDAPHLQEGKVRCMNVMKATFDDPTRCRLIGDDYKCPTETLKNEELK